MVQAHFFTFGFSLLFSTTSHLLVAGKLLEAVLWPGDRCLEARAWSLKSLVPAMSLHKPLNLSKPSFSISRDKII